MLTFRELQHQIVNFDQYLDGIIQDFETDELSKYYIDLVAQDDGKMIDSWKLTEPGLGHGFYWDYLRIRQRSMKR